MAEKFTQTSYYPDFDGANGIQKLTVNSTAATLSSAMGANIELFRLVGDAAFWYKTGSSLVTAASSAGGKSVYVPAATPEYFNTKKKTFVSVIMDTSTAAFVNVTQMTQ